MGDQFSIHELVEKTGTQGVELILWLAARAAVPALKLSQLSHPDFRRNTASGVDGAGYNPALRRADGKRAFGAVFVSVIHASHAPKGIDVALVWSGSWHENRATEHGRKKLVRVRGSNLRPLRPERSGSTRLSYTPTWTRLTGPGTGTAIETV